MKTSKKKSITIFLIGIFVGLLIAIGINAWKVWSFHQLFVDPISYSCEYRDNLFWNTEHWNWEANWKCK